MAQDGEIRFSVVIPLYNKRRYVRDTLQSVLAQSYPRFEIIVVDDGSTDESVEIVKSINDNRIRVIEQRNSGVSVARNRGVWEAKERYVALLDADDWWHPDYLQRMVRLIEECPKAGLYAARYAEVQNQVERPFDLRVAQGFGQGYVDYFELYARTFMSPVWTSAVVIPKDVFVRVGGFPEGIRAGEDIMLWIKIASQEKVAYLNEVSAYYNHDVDANERLSKKLYGPKENYIFGLGQLRDKKNVSLCYLIDGLILRTLRPYYALGVYSEATHDALREIDFRSQPLIYRLYYGLPQWCAKLVYVGLKRIRRLLS